jgi:hypothetical protein
VAIGLTKVEFFKLNNINCATDFYWFIDKLGLKKCVMWQKGYLLFQ